MSRDLAHEIVDTLRQIMATRDAERILGVVDDLLAVDANAIDEAAEQFIALTDLGELACELFPGEEPRERLLMRVFYASVLDVLCETCPSCEDAVEHDIPTWIEANAPELARNTAELLRLAMPGGGTLEAIDPRLAIDHLEARQLAMLQATWAAIEGRVDTLLAATGHATP